MSFADAILGAALAKADALRKYLTASQVTAQTASDVAAAIAANSTVVTAASNAVASRVSGLALPTVQDLGDDTIWNFVAEYTSREAAFGQRIDGSFFPTAKVETDLASLREDADGSGWRWYLRYADSREVAFGQRTDGSYFPSTLGSTTALTVQIGDSLTANWAGSTSPLVIAGRSILNIGIGGQTSYQVAARQGGAPARLAAAVIIPATGTVAVTLDRRLRSDTSGASTVIVQGIVGTFISTGPSTGGNADYTAGTFAPTAARAYPVPVPIGTPVQTGFDIRGYWPIVWVGRNNFKGTNSGPAGGVDTAGQVVADAKAILDFSTDTARQHGLVLSIPPWAGEESGTSVRAQLDSVNAALRDAFPTMFLDLAAILRNTDVMTAFGFTPTSQDITDIGNGLTPTSLRLTSDAGHWNANAYTIANAIINAEYAARGWL